MSESFDPNLLLDRRMWRESEVDEHMAMLRAALMSPHTVAYPVDFHGSVVTVLGYQRSKNEIVPLCVVLPPDEWVNIPQVSDDWNAVRTPNG